MALSSASTAFTVAAPATQWRSSVLAAARSGESAPRNVADEYGHSGSVKTLAMGAGVALGFGGAIFKKATRARAATRATFNPAEAVGVLKPFGYWDPCGLMKEREGKDGFRWKDEETFEQYRTAELKHGRLAMLALTGSVTAGLSKFPMYQGDAYKGIEGWGVVDTPAASGIGLFFVMASYFELTQPKGDFKDPLGVGASEGWGYTKEVQNKELAHGRLAMAAVLSLWLYDYGAKVMPSELIHHVNTLFVAAFPALLLVWSSSQDEVAAPAKAVPVAINGEAATQATLEKKAVEEVVEAKTN